MKGKKGFINNASKKATENFGDSKIKDDYQGII